MKDERLTKITGAIRNLPKGGWVLDDLYLSADTPDKEKFQSVAGLLISTDDLTYLIDRLEEIDEMLKDARAIVFPGALNMGEEMVQLSTGWRFLLGDGKLFGSPIDAYKALKLRSEP